MDMNDIKISQKMKNKDQLSIENKYYKAWKSKPTSQKDRLTFFWLANYAQGLF